MRTHLVYLTLTLVALAVNSGGCLIVAAGAGAAGAVAYAQGDLETLEPYPLDTVYAVTQGAVTGLHLSILNGKTEKDALSATIVARDAEDKRVTIRLKAQNEQSTKISIRIGTFGDHTKSQMIYNRIREDLKAVVPPPVSARLTPSGWPPTPPATRAPGTPPPVPTSEVPNSAPAAPIISNPPAPSNSATPASQP